MRLFRIDVPIATALTLLTLVTVVAVLPISVSGLGTAQATAVALLSGYAPAGGDPRAIILEKLGHQVAEGNPDRQYFDLSLKLRDYLARKLEGKPLYPNVDFFSASVYKMLGIPTDLYTPIFAMSRIVGWTAHLLEQYADNRLVRPNALYEGAENREYVPIASRG